MFSCLLLEPTYEFQSIEIDLLIMWNNNVNYFILWNFPVFRAGTVELYKRCKGHFERDVLTSNCSYITSFLNEEGENVQIAEINAKLKLPNNVFHFKSGRKYGYSQLIWIMPMVSSSSNSFCYLGNHPM